MSKKVIYKVSISRHVREVATFYVEADDSIDPDTVNETELAEAVYEAEAGEAACLWETDVEYGAVVPARRSATPAASTSRPTTVGTPTRSRTP